MINLTDLQQASTHYDPVLRYLPHVLLEEYIKEMHFNLQTVSAEDKLINMRRAGSLLKPYKGTVKDLKSQELIHPEESTLTPRMGYLALVDNIQNYRDKTLVMKAGRTLDNRKKEHPYTKEVLENIVKTFVEDFTLAIPHAKYKSAESPLGVFDGYNTIIDALVADTKITAAAGNLVECEEIKAPATDAEALKPLQTFVGWVRALNPMLRSGALDILVPSDTLNLILDSYEIQRRYTGEISRQALALYVRDKASLAQTPTIISNPIMGLGSRLIATRPGNITVGISAPADIQFVQVRSVYTDPNLVQFWMQADMGTRLDDWNAKVFATNGGTIKMASALAGDYTL